MRSEHREMLWQRLAPHVSVVARRYRRRRALAPALTGASVLLVATALIVSRPWEKASLSFPVTLRLDMPTQLAVATVHLERGAGRAVADDRVHLDFGRVHVNAHARFSLETAEAVVEVLGTDFSVTRDEGHTIVEVREGRVRVTPKPGLGLARVLGPGDRATVPERANAVASLSTHADDEAPASHVTLVPAPAEAVKRSRGPRVSDSALAPSASPKPTPATGPPAATAEDVPAPGPASQTPAPSPPPAPVADPAAEADEARVRGNTRQALELYLSAGRGDGLRAENALVQAARLCAGPLADPVQASAIWREVLARFPAGAHHEQALLGLALSLDRAGQSAEARQVAERLVAEHPDTPGAREGARLLDRLRQR
jgi:FecR-like protein/tetratricopeptide repeat protein